MDASKRSLLWFRLGAAAVTLLVMAFLLRRIRLSALSATIQDMNPAWVLASAAVFGLLFLAAAFRWHLALEIGRRAVTFGTSVKYSLIGHFFYAVLFGAAGGDTAKSAMYARRYHMPLADALVAASLDRLLGFAGLLLFASTAFAIAATHGAFKRMESVSFHGPKFWVWLVVIAVVVVLVVLSRFRRGSIWERFVSTFVTNGRRLLSSRKALFSGIGCGFLVQMALSATLALNLQAVSDQPLRWGDLIWTFPVIGVVSALPISVAGIGVRDGAAVALLGLCGVPGADALAASLLTAAINLLWAAVGGLLTWHETGQAKKRENSEALNDVVPQVERSKVV